MLKLALVVNEPPPYRIPVFNRMASCAGVQLKVIFCCRREPNRQWNLPAIAFDHTYLRERIRTVHGRYIHNNPDVLLALTRFSPDVVIGNGFNPTHLYALLWALARRRAYVPMTDGTLASEKNFSSVHRSLRRFVYGRADAAIAASRGGLALYRSYGVPDERCYLSCLCTDNPLYQAELAQSERSWDFIFSGRLEPGKCPEFALDVAANCARRLGRKVRMLLVGSGSMEPLLRQRAAECPEYLEVLFQGFARQEDLPGLYRSAKIFLFPTRADVWGVVANEACAAGLPVLVTPYAGVSGELIVDGKNGYIRELDLQEWTACALKLLQNEWRCKAFGQHSQLLVEPYHFDAAARGIVDAASAALARRRPDQAVVRRPA